MGKVSRDGVMEWVGTRQRKVFLDGIATDSIELLETLAILQRPDIEDCYVAVRQTQSREKELIVYVASRQALNLESLEAHLRTVLASCARAVDLYLGVFPASDGGGSYR